jgi:hypothetical protein
MPQLGSRQTALHRRQGMVDQALHEYAAALSAAHHANLSLLAGAGALVLITTRFSQIGQKLLVFAMLLLVIARAGPFGNALIIPLVQPLPVEDQCARQAYGYHRLGRCN